MKAGSTVDDPEVAAMVTSGLANGPFYSGGGFSNFFPSDCYYLTLRPDTDKISNLGCLDTREVLLMTIHRDI